MDKQELSNLNSLFKYPPFVIGFDFGYSNVGDALFEHLMNKVRNIELAEEDLHAIYWGAFAAADRNQILIENNFLEKIGKLDDIWFFRFAMLLSLSHPAELIKSEMVTDHMSKRIVGLIDSYISDSQYTLDSKESSLFRGLAATMNLLCIKAKWTSLPETIRKVRTLVKEIKYLHNSMIKSLALGVLTNYLFSQCSVLDRSELEEILPDIIGAGVNCLRFDIYRDHPQVPVKVPFTPRDFSVSLALLRNACIIAKPPMLYTYLVSNKDIAINFRLANDHDHDNLLDLLVNYLAQVLQKTPDQHAVHCLFRLVHSKEWNNLEHALKQHDDLNLCIQKLEHLVAHTEMHLSLTSAAAQMCIWTLRPGSMTADNFSTWARTAYAFSTDPSLLKTAAICKATQKPMDVSVARSDFWLNTIQDMHKDNRYHEINLVLSAINLFICQFPKKVQERLEHYLGNMKFHPENKENIAKILDKIKFLKLNKISHEDVAEVPNILQLAAEVDGDKSRNSSIRMGQNNKLFLRLYPSSDSPFIYAQEHAIMMAEVESLPSFLWHWEHHSFRPSSYASINFDRLHEAKRNDEVLIELKAFVVGIYPRPHWPNEQVEETSVVAGAKILLYNWKQMHPFDAFVYIKDGKDILLCNHYLREVHLFTRYSPNNKKND